MTDRPERSSGRGPTAPRSGDVSALTWAQLVALRATLDEHISNCCGAEDGSCQNLALLGEVQFILSKGKS